MEVCIYRMDEWMMCPERKKVDARARTDPHRNSAWQETHHTIHMQSSVSRADASQACAANNAIIGALLRREPLPQTHSRLRDDPLAAIHLLCDEWYARSAEGEHRAMPWLSGDALQAALDRWEGRLRVRILDALLTRGAVHPTSKLYAGGMRSATLTQSIIWSVAYDVDVGDDAVMLLQTVLDHYDPTSNVMQRELKSGLRTLITHGKADAVQRMLALQGRGGLDYCGCGTDFERDAMRIFYAAVKRENPEMHSLVSSALDLP